MLFVTQGFPGAYIFIKKKKNNWDESSEIILVYHIPNLDNFIDRFFSWMN